MGTLKLIMTDAIKPYLIGVLVAYTVSILLGSQFTIRGLLWTVPIPIAFACGIWYEHGRNKD